MTETIPIIKNDMMITMEYVMKHNHVARLDGAAVDVGFRLPTQ